MLLKHEEVVQVAYEKDYEYEARATDCCQCVIAAIQDAINCRNDDILKGQAAPLQAV